VVSSCGELGWAAAARGHRLEQLPKPAQEYLALDVTAFEADVEGWAFPIAVFELENDPSRLAFSLWKVLAVAAPLRVAVGYAQNQENGASIVEQLRLEVVQAIKPVQLAQLSGEVFVVIGSRGDATTFPYGFFKWWGLNQRVGQFELI
jgi:hypothetical protein